MRIDTSEPSLIRLFEKGQVGLIRTEFMRKDDVIASLAAENERLRADVSDASSLQSFLKWKGMEWEYKEWLDWRAERPVTLTNSKTWQVLGEYAEAKEQIARLENAGEKMADIVWHIRTPEAHEALHDWLAAKEGRDAK